MKNSHFVSYTFSQRIFLQNCANILGDLLCAYYSMSPLRSGFVFQVMVWIYGGSFQDGSERLYDGSALAGLHDVVVVIPNYRLNVFGFLSLGKETVCPGNVGLWDQNMALQ